MSDFDRNYAAATRGVGADRAVIDAGLRAYMLRIYNYMAMGVALTGIVSWITFNAAVTETAGRLALTPFGQMIFSGPAVLVLFLGTLGLVILISWRIDRLQPATALALFMLYAGLLGLMLSSIFLTYTGTSITRVFFISAASFAGLSLYGYTTQRDLSPIGSFLMMGLIGLIIAMVVNIFLKSSGLDFVISAVGVLIFAGLTAWDTQKIKEMYEPDGGRHGRRPQGGDGRADALSRLHQPVPVPAAPVRRSPLTPATGSDFCAPAMSRGAFFRTKSLSSSAQADDPIITVA